jgi:acetylornithine/succinyldiaminopimelate/putrescine aminotransferase/predicted amino acid dehydrogenase
MNALNPARAELLKTFRLDLAIVRGSGFRLFDESGREYLDYLAQYGALPFGHNPEHIWAALAAAREAQAPSMIQPLRCLAAERLAERLAELAPGDLGVVTFANSGAETVEAAIKLARVRTGRDRILSTRNGFHGKTLGALSATGNPRYQTDFGAPFPGFDYLPYGDLDALRERLETGADDVAAFIVEPIQGEGGVVCPPEGYLDGVIALCRAHGVLSIVDEIQTGLGRTGALFASSGCAEAPDMLLLAKALGGGVMPIGACIARPSAWDERFGTLHSSTFANNGLACQVGLATLERLLADDGALIRDVAANGAYLRQGLEEIRTHYPDVVREVRGRGYMQALEFHRFDQNADSATMAFASLNGGVTALISSYLMNVAGVLTAPLFNDSHVLRLQPPLVAGRPEADRALNALSGLCELLHRRDYSKLVRHLADPSQPVSAAPKPASEPGNPQRTRGAKPKRPGSFGFVIHYTENEDILRSDPSFRNFSTPELAEWQNWVKRLGAGFARQLPRVVSRDGSAADGWIMSVPMLPDDMRGRGRQAAVGMIRDAVDLAGQEGLSRVGLGAFTSVVTRGGDMVTGRGVPITSGNTLTTWAAVESLEGIARRVGLDVGDAHVVVIGASGAIGRLAALMLARRARRLTLVGNAANPFAPRLLARIADEIRAPGAAHLDTAHPGAAGRPFDGAHVLRRRLLAAGAPPAVTWTTDREAALAEADIVLVATSSDQTLVQPSDLRPGTLVCDVARPPNVAEADVSRHGVLVFDGGLVHPPSAVDLGPFQVLPAGLCWGCLGETMLLSLARETGDFSIGSRLSLADADRLGALAARHGFEPAVPRSYGRLLTQGDFDSFARQVQARSAVRGNSASGGFAVKAMWAL